MALRKSATIGMSGHGTKQTNRERGDVSYWTHSRRYQVPFRSAKRT
jgi:hypothetical protein